MSSAFPRVPAAAHQFAFDRDAEPALTVAPGDAVVIETLDCFSDRLAADGPLPRDDRDVLAHVGGRYNPVSRPLFLRGAEPGDTLAVGIVDIALGRGGGGVTHLAHDWARGFGGNAFADAVAPALVGAEISGGRVRLPLGGRVLDVPAEAMIGTIGTAPAGDPVGSLFYAPRHGGNLDCPRIRAGATLLLPVNVPGGLLSLGDAHALMGDGEVTGTALETSADVTVRLDLRKGQAPLTTPRLVDDASVGSIGCVSRTDVHENVRAATLDLVRFLGEEFAVPLRDGLLLVGLFGRIVVNQSVRVGGSGWSSVLVQLARSVLA